MFTMMTLAIQAASLCAKDETYGYSSPSVSTAQVPARSVYERVTTPWGCFYDGATGNENVKDLCHQMATVCERMQKGDVCIPALSAPCGSLSQFHDY